MSEMTELTVVLPVFLIEDAEDMIDEAGFHQSVEDFAADAIRGLLVSVMQGYEGELREGIDPYMTLRETFPDARRITLSVPKGLADTLSAYLEKTRRDVNLFAGVAVDRLCRELDIALDESMRLFGEGE